MKRLTILLLFSLLTTLVSAQDWYFTPTVSQSHQFGEFKRLKDAYTEYPGLNLAVGDNFNRFIGARVSLGFSPMSGRAPQKPEVGEMFTRYRFYAATGHIDAMFNVLELFRSSSDERRTALYVIAGVGGMKTMMYDKKVNGQMWQSAYPHYVINSKGGFYPAARAGLAANIKLSHSIDFVIEGKYNFVPDEFNGSKFGGKMDNYLEANLGISWHFAQKRSRHPRNMYVTAVKQQNQTTTWQPETVTPATTQWVTDNASATVIVPVKEQPRGVSEPKAKKEKPVKEKVAKEKPVKEKPAKAPKSSKEKKEKKEKNTQVMEREVFVEGARMQTGIEFMYGFSELTANQNANLQRVADMLNENPNARIIIHGYADVEAKENTASKNGSLAMLRAQAVAEKLTHTYLISGSRVSCSYHSNPLTPYSGGDWVRAVEFEMVK